MGRVILEESLVLYRDGEGRPACLLDRCLHRNARLSEGRVEGGLLACPYHGWKYAVSGACVGVPSLGPDQKGLPAKRLQSFPHWSETRCFENNCNAECP